MISHFFIDRPIFATVLSVAITLAGGIAVSSLPVARYPPISPPQVQVAINYPGASAQVVADTVAAPIEQEVNGVPGMLYMTSTSGNAGTYTLYVTFQVGTDLNTALVMVQNRVQLALPLLPIEVQNQGITIRKKTPDILMVISLFSPDDRYDGLYLSNFATINLYDPLLRVDGVSDISILGEPQYSIRAWLDPQKRASRGMNATDVAAAVAQQNVEAAPGRIGQPPSGRRPAFDLPIDALGRLTYSEQFGDIIVKVGNSRPRPRSRVNPLPFSGAGMLGSGDTNPVPFTGTSGGPVGLPGFDPMTGIATTTPSATIPGGTTSGGTTTPGTTGSTTGSGMATGGATTGGGAMTNRVSGGKGTPAGAPPSGMGIPGLSINTGPSGGGTGAQPVQALGLSRVAAPATAIVRLQDVARTELGAQNYNQTCTFDGRPSAGLAIFSLPGTNALDVADRVRARMAELKQRFPDGIDYVIAYDTTRFIRESVNDVVRTLLVAVGLVVLAFLQNWRAVLIPMLAVPVAIVGTFAVMAAVGFSLNNISLFGLVLAIGIVVDDAIVVVENVERWLKQGYAPREAARKAMDEVTGPVIAVALVLCAVFVPCTFLGGISGQFFRQFAVTISVSTVISAFNSLTLSPALAALLLKPRAARPDPPTRLLNLTFGWFFRGFNWLFGAGTTLYTRGVAGLLRVSAITLLVCGGLLGLTYLSFTQAPTGFIPEQDAGYILLTVQLPDAASVQRTEKVMAHIDQLARATPGVAHTVGVSGQSLILNANAPNLGSVYVILKSFEERRGDDQSAAAIAADLTERCRHSVPGAVVTAFGAPPIAGLGTTGGFKLIIEDRSNLGLSELQRVSDQVVARGNKTAGLQGLFNSGRADTPGLYLNVDRTKCYALGVAVSDVFATLQFYLGSYYVNNFNEFGRSWQVNVQADQNFRELVPDLLRLQVRNSQGHMVRLATLMTVSNSSGPASVMRYNMYSATAVTGNPAPGTSSGQAIDLMREVANQTLPNSMASEWTELTYLQLQVGSQAIFVFALTVVFVFLVLAAQYESWSLPLAVILVVPMCLLCAIVGVRLAGMEVNLFTQIGFVVLVGLTSKNAILIGEFAKQRQEAGVPRREATLEACRLRLRPILMTSFAFILGVVPLVIATGAGAEMRRALGQAVFSGMLGVTLFGIFLTPVFFYVIRRFSRAPSAQSAPAPEPTPSPPVAH